MIKNKYYIQNLDAWIRGELNWLFRLVFFKIDASEIQAYFLFKNPQGRQKMPKIKASGIAKGGAQPSVIVCFFACRLKIRNWKMTQKSGTFNIFKNTPGRSPAQCD